MQINKIFTSRVFLITTWALAFLIIVFVAFSAGVRVGINKASHNFERRGMAPRFMPQGTGTPSAFMERGELKETHGASGIITEISTDNITVEDRNGEDRKVIINTETKLRSKGDDIVISNLSKGDFVVVFGETDINEQVVAKLIRVMPKIGDMKPVM